MFLGRARRCGIRRAHRRPHSAFAKLTTDEERYSPLRRGLLGCPEQCLAMRHSRIAHALRQHTGSWQGCIAPLAESWTATLPDLSLQHAHGESAIWLSARR